jgi:hypothetical protein
MKVRPKKERLFEEYYRCRFLRNAGRRGFFPAIRETPLLFHHIFCPPALLPVQSKQQYQEARVGIASFIIHARNFGFRVQNRQWDGWLKNNRYNPFNFDKLHFIVFTFPV